MELGPLNRYLNLLDPAGLTIDELQRYGRHLVLPEVGVEGQKRLKRSSVLIVGLGGLGIPAAVQLASAGIGKIGIVDPDIVEVSNLQRQFIFSERDVGRRKVEAAEERLALVNPAVKVSAHPVELDSRNAMQIISEYDLVLDATDRLPSRYLINDACVLQGKPDVFASALGFDAQATVFNVPGGPCYRCLYPEPPPSSSVMSCEQVGVLSVIPSIMGSIQANQAVGLLLGKGTPLVGRLLIFNGLDNSFSEIKFNKNSSCVICGSNRVIANLIDYEEFCGTKHSGELDQFDITALELKEAIGSGEHPLLLDVREPNEYSVCHLESSILIPVDELSSSLGELDKNREIVVYCHVGIRSAGAAALLRQSGFTNVRNLQGGIDAWARQVDSNMPRY